MQPRDLFIDFGNKPLTQLLLLVIKLQPDIICLAHGDLFNLVRVVGQACFGEGCAGVANAVLGRVNLVVRGQAGALAQAGDHGREPGRLGADERLREVAVLALEPALAVHDAVEVEVVEAVVMEVVVELPYLGVPCGCCCGA